MYNRSRDATVTTKAGAVVWKFVTGSSQQHVIHGQSTMQQLQVRVCVFEDTRFSSPFFRFDLIVTHIFQPFTSEHSERTFQDIC